MAKIKMLYELKIHAAWSLIDKKISLEGCTIVAA